MLMKLAKIVALIAVCSATNTHPGFAQVSGCQSEELSDPPRVVYSCANGLIVEAEALAALELATSADPASIGPAEVSEGAVLIDLQSGGVPFQISTPYVIASVRGTVFIIDTQPLRTSVFVVEGVVVVSRPDQSNPVQLDAGDGVDVSPDTPLTVRQWPQERVSVLLARFGR